MKKLLVLISILFCSQTITASSILFEPYMGYHYGSYDDASISEKATGFGMGARTSYVDMGLMFGGELQFTILDSDRPSGEVKIEQNQFGVSGGFIFPGLPMRAYLTWYLYDRAKLKPGGTMTGDGIKLGMGFDPIPLLSFNLEYKRSHYDKIKDAGSESSLDPKRSVSTLYFSVGFLFSGDL